jgi:hypothetical protein
MKRFVWFLLSYCTSQYLLISNCFNSAHSSWHNVFFIFVVCAFFYWIYWGLNSGLKLAEQMLYHLCHSASPLLGIWRTLCFWAEFFQKDFFFLFVLADIFDQKHLMYSVEIQLFKKVCNIGPLSRIYNFLSLQRYYFEIAY